MAGYFRRFGKYAFMHGKKIKSPKIYSKHKSLRSNKLYDSKFYQFAIIDPGPDSCGIRIERLYLKTGEKKLIWFSTVNFGSDTADINTNMKKSMRYVEPFLTNCQTIGIEDQFMKSEVNYQCFSALIYYITTNICTKNLHPNLYGIDIKLKTTYIGGPSTKTQNGGKSIKKWSKKKALKTCKEEKDYVSYNILKCSYSKPSTDLADTKCYCIGWIKYVMETDLIYLPFNKKHLEKFRSKNE